MCIDGESRHRSKGVYIMRMTGSSGRRVAHLGEGVLCCACKYKWAGVSRRDSRTIHQREVQQIVASDTYISRYGMTREDSKVRQ